MTDDLFTNSTQFLRAVIELKKLPPYYQSLVAHAAAFWSMDRLRQRVESAAMWEGPLPESPPPDLDGYASGVEPQPINGILQ